jgi:hypothetical protein
LKIDELCIDCPKEFGIFLAYTRGLKFEERPDYAYCNSLLDLVTFREKINLERLDWLDNQTDDLSLASEGLRNARKKNRTDKEVKKIRKSTRSKTVLGRGRRLPNRSDVIFDRSDNVEKFAFDESTYNSLEITPRNVLPEFRNKKHVLSEKSNPSCCVV